MLYVTVLSGVAASHGEANARSRILPVRCATWKVSPNEDVSKPDGAISSKGSFDCISPFATEWAAFVRMTMYCYFNPSTT